MITRPVEGRRAALTWRHFAAAAIAAAIALATAQPAWASWAEQGAPSPATNAGFSGVSCMSPTACLAVGSYANSNGTFQLAETSNGSAWTETDPENPPGATNTVLNGVSCTPGWCMAVGDSTTGSASSLVSQMWNGSGWTAEPVPNPAGASSSQFNGVSCTGTGCVAAGSYTTAAGTFPLAESWDGSTWTPQTTQNPPGTNSQLDGVSCVSLTSCEAVGSSQTSTGSLALAENLTGTTWAIQPTPSAAGLNNLNGVACSSATRCIAVGTGIADAWNGTTWTATNPVKPPHDTSGPPSFGGVACAAATSCVAVGTYYDDAVPTEAAEQWNGTAWHTQSLSVSDSTSSGLGGVACPVPHACTAVGSFQDTTTNNNHTLVQVYSLTWQDQGVPALGGTINSSLSGISCQSTKLCYVAGTFTDTSGNVTGFVWDGNGSTWSVQSVASLSYSSFSGIWCPATTSNCVVVGQTSGPKPLAETWNGAAFAQQPTPLPPTATDGAFNSVSCSSPSNCLAVGFYDVSDNEHALAEAWNGSTWQVVNPPEPTGSTYTVLTGVSCTASSCVAVGNYGDPASNQQPLAEVYTAGSWTAGTVPLPSGATSPSLTAVSCPATSACLAVGQYFNGSHDVPLAEKWNGTTWTHQAPPAPSGSVTSGLAGVTCKSATACVAVGSWFGSGSDSSILAEGLNGQTWGIQATQATGSTNNELLGVSCPSAISCTAVGDDSGPNPQQLLVEVYS